MVAIGATYLQIVSWNFVAAGLAFTASSMFQAIGNSWPSLISSGTRLVTYVAPAIWLGTHGNFELTLLWWMSVGGVTLQAIVALILLAQQFRQRLVPTPAGGTGLAGVSRWARQRTRATFWRCCPTIAFDAGFACRHAMESTSARSHRGRQ